VLLSGGVVPDSDRTSALPAGTYAFTASYSGDGNYTGSVSPVEPLVIDQGTSSTSTAIVRADGGPLPSPVPLGTQVADTATVAGSPSAFAPTGTVTYTFMGTNGTTLAGLTAPPSWTVVNATTWTETVTLTVGVVPDSGLTAALPDGTYAFTASYSGDGNYAASVSPVEPLVIDQSTTMTATAIASALTNAPIPYPFTASLGTSVFDTAMIINQTPGFPATGTVTYTFTGTHGTSIASLTPPPSWTVSADKLTWAETVTVSGGTVPASDLTGPLPAGNYAFTAAYSGDPNYTGSDSPVEPIVIDPGSSATATAILTADGGTLPSPVPLGTIVRDTATVTGSPAVFPPTGTVTYTFTGTNGTSLAGLTPPPSWTVSADDFTWTKTVTLNGGTVPESDVTPPLPEGTYAFTAAYGGDGNYTGSSSSVEPLVIDQAMTATVTEIADAGTNKPIPSPFTVAPGTTVFDTATVIGQVSGIPATGSVTYTFTGTNGTSLAALTAPPAWTVVSATTWTETVTLSGGAVPESAPIANLPAGTYAFTAEYSGFGSYEGSVSPVEPLTISQAPTTVATAIVNASNHTPIPPPFTVAPGTTIFDTATILGQVPGVPAMGTVTYTFTGTGGTSLSRLTPPPGWTAVNSTTWKETVTLIGGAVPDSAPIANLPAGTYAFEASYNGFGTYAGSGSAVEPLTVQRGPAISPTVLALQRFGYHAQPTEFVLTFSSALDPTRADNPRNYTLTPIGENGPRGRRIPIISAVYNPVADTVTLHPARRVYLFAHYQLVVNGMAPSGVSGPTGVLLDGRGNGVPGSDYVRVFGPRILAGPNRHLKSSANFKTMHVSRDRSSAHENARR
jgi:hypothetical protein